MDISLAPEPVFNLWGHPITNAVLTGWVVTLLFLVVALFLRRYTLNRYPSRLQALVESVYEGFYGLAVSIVRREEVVREMFPFVITAFLYIVISSWFGLIPGVSAFGIKEIINGHQVIVPLFRAPTTDLNATLALAVISVTYVQYLGIKHTGARPYLGKFINFSSPIHFAVGLLELISELSRIISYSFRLFGNIFAGEVLIGVMLFLTTTLLPYLPPVPLLFFVQETAVALIQAFVFCFLTIVFASLAIDPHEEELDSPNHSSVTLQESP